MDDHMAHYSIEHSKPKWQLQHIPVCGWKLMSSVV